MNNHQTSLTAYTRTIAFYCGNANFRNIGLLVCCPPFYKLNPIVTHSIHTKWEIAYTGENRAYVFPVSLQWQLLIELASIFDISYYRLTNHPTFPGMTWQTKNRANV